MNPMKNSKGLLVAFSVVSIVCGVALMLLVRRDASHGVAKLAVEAKHKAEPRDIGTLPRGQDQGVAVEVKREVNLRRNPALPQQQDLDPFPAAEAKHEVDSRPADFT